MQADMKRFPKLGLTNLFGLAMFLIACLRAYSAITPPRSLDNEISHRPIDDDVRNLVICIHGWNNPKQQDRYVESEEWALLVKQLSKALPTPSSEPWQLLLYHWEQDAATGLIDWNVTSENPIANARDASRLAWSHGKSLGSRLPASLRRVHIIAHSAGAWAAYKTLETLLEHNPFVIFQVTLLDPYIPDQVYPDPYSVSLISDLAFFDIIGGDVSLLENYFADDIIPGTLAAPTLGTQSTFSWGDKGINQQVEWDPNLFHPPGENMYYDWHSGPILFYSDTVQATLGSIPFRLPTDGNPYDYHLFGWYRSLPYRLQHGELPAITRQPASQSIPAGNKATLTVSASGSPPFTYQWFKNKSYIIDKAATNSTYTFKAQSEPASYAARVTDSKGNVIYSDEAFVAAFAADLIVTGVSPSVLPSSTEPQNIKITGSGFTATSTLKFNDNITADPSRLTIVNANEITYKVIVGTSAAKWAVRVINGDQRSNEGYFLVANSDPSPGSVTLNLLPSGAVSFGAQWRVDGGVYHNNGDTATGLAAGPHTISFKTVPGYTAPASRSIDITSSATKTDTGIYTATTPSTYTLTLTVDDTQGDITPHPLGGGNGNIYKAGDVVQLTANAKFGYHFVGWAGALSGAANPSTIVIDGNKSVAANFAPGDSRLGTATVTILPPEAAAAGVKWGTAYEDYRASGSSYTADVGTRFLVLHPVDGWISPFGGNLFLVTLTAEKTTNVTVTLQRDTTPGLLTVNLLPPDSVASARWHISGGTTGGSGSTVSLPPGPGYTISFDPVDGWTRPPNQTVNITRGQTLNVTGTYTPVGAQPVISSIYPRFGALSGSTGITIEGANFSAPASVMIGGKAAQNVTVISASQIACLTPPSSAYGTVPVVIQTPKGSVSAFNGFSYGAERGSGFELMSSIGGRAYAVAVQGNLAYVGEGNSLLVVNVENSAIPFLVGRLAMPGMVRDIAVAGQYLYVANGDAGLQVVDISNPAAPLLKGFHAATGYASGITIFDGRAYLADGAGLEIFELGAPTFPSLLSSINYNGKADDVVVAATGSGVFAFLSGGSRLCAIDVSQPLNPQLRGNLAIGGYAPSLSLAGNYLIAVIVGDGVRIIDVSVPNNPTDGGLNNVVFSAQAATVANNLLYLSGVNNFKVFSYSGGSLNLIGESSSLAGDGHSMVVAGNRLYSAGGRSGFTIGDVSNPSSPSKVSSYTDSGAYGDFESAALSGHNLITGGSSGLKIIDVGNPSTPNLLWQSTAVGSSHIVVNSSFAYFSGSGVQILDFNNPAAPIIKPGIPISEISPGRMVLSGNTLLVSGQSASGIARILIADISNPTAPAVHGILDFPENQVVSSVAAIGTKAVIVTEGSAGRRLQVVNISNIDSPTPLGIIDNIGNTQEIQMSLDGNYVYIADGSSNLLRVVDVSNSGAPIQIGSVSVPGRPYAIRLNGSIAYVSVRYDLSGNAVPGVYSYDIADPAIPKLTRSYLTAGEAKDIAMSTNLGAPDGVLFVPNSDGGLAVLKVKDIFAPAVNISEPTSVGSYTSNAGSLSIKGGASDNQGVSRVTWSNDRGGGGDAIGTSDWTVNGISLLPGVNVLTVTAFDLAGNTAKASIAVTYQPSKQDQSIYFQELADKGFGDPPINLFAAASSGLPIAYEVVAGPAVINNVNLLMVTSTGTVTVRAMQSGNELFNPAGNVYQSFTVTNAAQVITFAPLVDMLVTNPAFALVGSASSGLPVTFSVVSGQELVTLNNNVVTLNGTGTVTVRASQVGSGTFNPAIDVERTFSVKSIPQSIAFGTLSDQTVGDAPFPLIATASSGNPVAFTVAGPASLSGNTLTITGLGLVTVTAAQDGNGIYAAAAPVSRSFSVVAPVVDVVSFRYLSIVGPSSIDERTVGQFAAIAVFSDGSSEPVSPHWSGSSAVASVSDLGVLTVGEVADDTTVAIYADYTIDGVTQSSSQDVSISNVVIPTTLVSINIIGVSSLNENGSAQYSATARFSDGSTMVVNPSWSADFPAASFSIFGLLSVGEVSSNTSVTVSARYMFGGVTRDASTNVLVIDTSIPPDISAPALAITFPANNATATKPNLSVTGTASDTGFGSNGISSVIVNGVSATGGSVSGANTANWSATITLNPGVNTISVVASDTFNNISQQQISVTYIPPDTSGPVLVITFPTNNATITSPNLSVIGTASDGGRGDHGVLSVNVNGVDASNGSANAADIASWKVPITLIPGVNVITVVARDELNNSSQQEVKVFYNPPPQTGSLQLTLEPPGAVAAGAQWQVDAGAWNSTGATVGDLLIGDHPIKFKAVTGWTVPGDQSVTIKGGQTTTAKATYVQLDTIPPSVAIFDPRDGAILTNAILTVRGTARDTGRGDHGISSVIVNGIDSINGTAVGAFPANFDATIPLTPGVNLITAVAKDLLGNSGQKQITVFYNPPPGYLRVSIEPAGAVLAGARWQVDGGPWQSSGVTVPISTAGNHTIAFNTVSEWSSPGNQVASIAPNQTFQAFGTYVASPRLPRRLNGIRLLNGVLQFVLNGSAGDVFLIQASSNLVDWISMSTNQIPASGFVPLIDTSPSSPLPRYFRAVPWTPPSRLTGMTVTNGVLHFALNGISGETFVLQSSPDLLSWSSVSTNTIPPSGSAIVTDVSTIGEFPRYYRAIPWILPNRLSGMEMMNGMLHLVLYGAPGETFVIQASSDLVEWISMTTNKIPVGGLVSITDSTASGQLARYFRAVPWTPPSQLTGITLINGVLHFVLNGTAGDSYVIQTSSDLLNWSSISTNTIPVGGSLAMVDSTASSQNPRYLRALPWVASHRLTAATVSDDLFRFSLNGPAGANYVIQTSSNLTSWSALLTNVIPANGIRVIEILPRLDHPRQYYRSIPLSQGPFVLQPGPADGQDIWSASVLSNAPNVDGTANGVADSKFWVGNWGESQYSFIKFDIKKLPQHASSATIMLYSYAGPITDRGNSGMYLDRIAEDWDVTFTTGILRWSFIPSGTNVRSIAAPSVNSWYSIDVTDIYNAWQSGTYPNYGLGLRPSKSGPQFNYFWSSRYMGDPSLRPRLVVTP